MIWITIIFFGVVVMQLSYLIKLIGRQFIFLQKTEEKRETDEMLKYRFPHLFYSWMKERLINQRDKSDIYKKILHSIKDKNNEKMEERFYEINKYSLNFFENFKKERDVTSYEINFVKSRVWETIDSYISEPEKILELTDEYVWSWHEEFEHDFPLKKNKK